MDERFGRRVISEFLVRAAFVATANGKGQHAAKFKYIYVDLFGVEMPAPTGYQLNVGLSWKHRFKDGRSLQTRGKMFSKHLVRTKQPPHQTEGPEDVDH